MDGMFLLILQLLVLLLVRLNVSVLLFQLLCKDSLKDSHDLCSHVWKIITKISD